jgi:hypothetical protein
MSIDVEAVVRAAYHAAEDSVLDIQWFIGSCVGGVG